MRIWHTGVLALLALGVVAAPSVQSKESTAPIARNKAGQQVVTITLVRWPFT